MNLQENIQRIKSIMGLLKEEEGKQEIPYGIIKFNDDKILVGMELKPAKTNPLVFMFGLWL